MSIRIPINCIAELLPPVRGDNIRVQLMHGIWGECHGLRTISSTITNFTNCLVQCRQNTGVFLMESVQHCILGTARTLAGFFSDLQTSNTCSKNADAVKMGGMDDFSKEIPSESMEEMNSSFSNTPASMDAVSSIRKTTDFCQTFGKSYENFQRQ